jgi:hypothetical protein
MSEDYVSEAELAALGITPEEVRAQCPWATELRGHDGVRCWSRVDLAPLLGGQFDVDHE